MILSKVLTLVRVGYSEPSKFVLSALLIRERETTSMFFVAFMQAIAAHRQNNYQRVIAYSGEPVERRLRLTANQLQEISREFHRWRVAKNQHAKMVTSEVRMDTFLHYLSCGGYYHQIAYAHGIATSTAFIHTYEAADYICDTAINYISLPTAEEFDDLMTPIDTVDGETKRVILYIDGVIMRIQRPDHAGDAYFCGRHGKF